jgi:hypothetical protein
MTEPLMLAHRSDVDGRFAMSGFDRLTQATAAAISRRALLKGLVGGLAASFGAGLLTPLPAAASCPEPDQGNLCTGPCGTCKSDAGICCSPSGQYCYDVACQCNNGCNCSCFQGEFIVWNSGCVSYSCPCCCFACFPCC